MVKIIPLTQSRVTVIDDEDHPLLATRSLYYNNGYAKFSVSKHEKVYVHRFLLGLVKGEECDHISGERLDNRRCNLRRVTRSQNNMNASKRKGTSSVFKGVGWSKEHGMWQVSIQLSEHIHHLGYYESEVEAAERYNQAATLLFGEYAKLNDLRDLNDV